MLPESINPMLAKRADAPFDSPEHQFEIKWDGIRCLGLIKARRVRLQSRQLLDITAQFPELACLAQLPSGTVLDGELVVMEHGKPSLRRVETRALLQNRTRIQFLSELMPVSYVVFDLLYLEDKQLLRAPLCHRRLLLERLIQRAGLPGILMSEVVRDNGRRLFAEVARLNLEGIMAKRLDSPYLPGRRCGHWMKIKTAHVHAKPLLPTTPLYEPRIR